MLFGGVLVEMLGVCCFEGEFGGGGKGGFWGDGMGERGVRVEERESFEEQNHRE